MEVLYLHQKSYLEVLFSIPGVPIENKTVKGGVYCNFLKEVRLGGWGSEGPKGPTLGQYVSA